MCLICPRIRKGNAIHNQIKESLGDPPYPYKAFVTKWKTDNTGETSSTQIKLPLLSGGNYNFIVDWGDGSTDKITQWDQAETTHTYSSAGTFTVTMTGQFDRWAFANAGDKLKIIEIMQWGDFRAENGSFYGCANVECKALDNLIFSGANAYRCFQNCTSLTNIGGQDADVSKVVDGDYMFQNADSFNTAYPNLNWKKLESGVIMFGDTPINVNMGWANMKNLVNCRTMFRQKGSFTQDISVIDFTNVTDFTAFLNGSTLPTTIYDQLLINLEAQNQNDSLAFHGGYSTYTIGSAAETARNALINDHSWTITDGGGV